MPTPNLFSLLPVYEYSQLVNKQQKAELVNLLHSLLTFSIRSLEAFKSKGLTHFDAQIGENLCQIRAYQLVFLTQKYLKGNYAEGIFQSKFDALTEARKRIKAFKQQWDDKISKTSSFAKDLDAKETASDFLNRHGLLIDLHPDIIYLTACYFLAQFSTKKQGILQTVSLDNIANHLCVSKARAKKLVQTLQHTVCTLGIDFIKELLDDLPLLSHYKPLFSELIQSCEDSRVILPCFMASEILFAHAIASNTPILLIVRRKTALSEEIDRIYLLLRGSMSHCISLDFAPSEDDLFSSCMVIEGEVHYSRMDDELESQEEYLKRLIQMNPVHSLLANTAIHPQYAGKNLYHLQDNPYQLLKPCQETDLSIDSFESMRRFAKETGCSKDNASTLLMLHAYASNLKYQLNDLNEKPDDLKPLKHNRELKQAFYTLQEQ